MHLSNGVGEGALTFVAELVPPSEGTAPPRVSGSRFLTGIFPDVSAIHVSDITVPAPPETALGFPCLPRVSEICFLAYAGGR